MGKPTKYALGQLHALAAMMRAAEDVEAACIIAALAFDYLQGGDGIVDIVNDQIVFLLAGDDDRLRPVNLGPGNGPKVRAAVAAWDRKING